MSVDKREPGRGLWAGKEMAPPRVVVPTPVSRKRLLFLAFSMSAMALASVALAGEWMAASIGGVLWGVTAGYWWLRWWRARR